MATLKEYIEMQIKDNIARIERLNNYITNGMFDYIEYIRTVNQRDEWKAKMKAYEDILHRLENPETLEDY